MYDTLAATLKNIAAAKALQYDIQEVVKTFGKTWRTNMNCQLKRRGVKCAVGIKNGTVYIWKRGA